MALIELKEVWKTYEIGKTLFHKGKKIEALKNVTLTLNEGSCLGLVGESSSGKSTLGRVILGLEKPDKGKIFFQGKNIYEIDKKELRELRRGMHAVFQDYSTSLNPRSSIKEIVSETLRNYEKLSYLEEKKKIESLLDVVGLKPEHISRYPHELSGGQLQRVCIARAISLKPKLIIMDEAVSGLDVSLQAQILNLLQDLKKELHLSFIFISHDIEAASYMSDSVAFMYKGEIVEVTSNIENIQNLEHPYSKKLLSSVLPRHPKNRKQLAMG